MNCRYIKYAKVDASLKTGEKYHIKKPNAKLLLTETVDNPQASQHHTRTNYITLTRKQSSLVKGSYSPLHIPSDLRMNKVCIT